VGFEPTTLFLVKEVQEKDLQVTLQVFFFALDREYFANSSPEVKQRSRLYPAVIPQNGITSPKL
jgi:hypothetical protein